MGQRFPGKVVEVVGHDDFRASAYRCGQNMPIVGIGQCQGVDQVFVACHEAVTDGLVHKGSGSGQPFG
jgi:hypothetical protein